MGWFSKNSGDPTNAGGTDWEAKKAAAGSKANESKDWGRGDWGKPETSGGSGGTLSDSQLAEEGLG